MGINIGDRVRLISDWLPKEARKKRVRVIGFQQNYNETYAQVSWIGKGSILYQDEFGTLFPMAELKKL